MIRMKNFMETGIVPYTNGFPPGTGEVFHLVVNKTTDVYYNLLLRRRVRQETIFTSLALAYAAMTSGQGDTLCVWPGDHVQTAGVTWAADNSRIIGMGPPNQSHQPSTLTTGATRLTCKTAAVSYVLTISGNYVQIYNIGTINTAEDALNLGDIYVTGKNFYAELFSPRGGNGAAQVGSATSGIPVTIAATAYAAKFKDSFIGSAGNTTRTTGPGFVKFETGAGGAGMVVFENTSFAMRSETTGDNVKGILIQEASIDRLLSFKGCRFYNFSINWGALPDHMICDQQTSTHDVLLHGGCGMMGFDSVSDSARVMTSDPIPNTAGVEALAVAIT